MPVLDLFRLDGRTALVTGGGSGLGLHMATALAEAGARVALCSRRLDVCEAAAEGIREDGGEALALECDVTDEAQVRSTVDAALGEFGAIDILVNNSGATWGAPPETMPVERFDRSLQVNVRGTFLVARTVAAAMIEREIPGSIINIASIAAFKAGRPGVLQAAGYAASKGAVVSLTRDLAGSWARHGIRVNAIAPGWFPTRMSKGVLAQAGDRLLDGIPLARFGGDDDLGGVAVFLASPASAYITGQTIPVDGGQTIW